MTILSDGAIRQLIQDKELITDYACLDTQLQPASFDVRLAADIEIPASSHLPIDPEVPETLRYTRVSLPKDIPPGGFILASTKERVELPADIVGIVNGRSTLGRLGLAIHVTAGYLDPGFCGQVTLEIANLGTTPIRLRAGLRVAQLVFHRMDAAAERPYGSKGSNHKYQHQAGTTVPRAEKVILS